jgi:hypothetical protein
MAFLAIDRGIDHITGVGQRLPQKPLEVFIVFNKQNAHDDLSMPPTPAATHAA